MIYTAITHSRKEANPWIHCPSRSFSAVKCAIATQYINNYVQPALNFIKSPNIRNYYFKLFSGFYRHLLSTVCLIALYAFVNRHGMFSDCRYTHSTLYLRYHPIKIDFYPAAPSLPCQFFHECYRYTRSDSHSRHCPKRNTRSHSV